MRSRDFRFMLAVLVAFAATSAYATKSFSCEKDASTRSASTYSFTDDSKDRFGFALFHDGGSNTIMNNFGDWADIDEMRGDAEDLLVFRMDGKRGVIRDAKVLQLADEACEEVIALGEEQGRLGERQGKLGGIQGELGGKQGEMGARQAEASMELQEIALEISRAARDGKSTTSLERKRAQIEEEIEDLSVAQREYGRQQTMLGAQQSALGKKQAELGARQSKASERAKRDVQELISAAIKDGQVEWVH